MKLLITITAVASIVLASSAFAITCPKPSEFKYKNGEWVAPKNWIFNQSPEGAPDDKVDQLVEVEWQSIVSGGHQGSVDWCRYTWKNEKGLNQLSVGWWGNPMFLQPAHMSYWTEVEDNKVFRCHSTIRNCALIKGTF